MTCEGVGVPFTLGLDSVQQFISADNCSLTPPRFNVPPCDTTLLLSSGLLSMLWSLVKVSWKR